MDWADLIKPRVANIFERIIKCEIEILREG